MTNKMNCEGFLNKCMASCCGIVPLPYKLVKRFKFVREVVSQERVGDVVLARDKDYYCPYLDKDYKCSIYKHRPDVCKKFGDESHPLVTCMWQDKNGNARSRVERRRINRLQTKGQNKVLNEFKKCAKK